MTNFNFEYKGTFLRYKDSNGNLLDLNGSQVDTDLDERTEQNEIDIAALQHYFDSISVKEDASGAVASFTDGADGIPVKSLVVNIEPIQEGTGDPSPENIRPISGRTEVNIWRDAEHDTTADPTITIQLGQTVYGGTLNVTTGVLTVNKVIVDMGTMTWNKNLDARLDVGYYFSSTTLSNKNENSRYGICSNYPVSPYLGLTATIAALGTSIDDLFFYTTGTGAYVIDGTFTDSAAFKTAMSGVQLCYELAQPYTVQLTPEQLTTLLGTNNIWADSGNVAVNYVADTKLYIDSAITASADSTESVNANNREEVKETVNEIEKPDVIEEKEVKDDNIEEEKEI